ncbi:MAG TPA: FtsQ-type POTRA domain-containing protein [Pseudomonas sp.]|jgi:cell division protein FtsQ|uniref:cell division protein FtsQ/DivIB n=1 Tax=Pseudomonas sp. TaxID=306 RepID=UPI002C1980BF|nr:FtsQ-type POTRA domain-containing protein [Pseudomonas sp.]HTO19832.1 FtsQ-type POTRA domain-containing protein [Pseudomonas sp.]
MLTFLLRHQQPGPGRKPAPRGASRPVVRTPLRARLPKPDFSALKRFTWPLLLVALLVGGVVLFQQLQPYLDRPIARIGIAGKLTFTAPEQVERVIEPYVSSRFFGVDLEGLRADLEALPWIAHAQVRRVWPDEVEIELNEYLPIARWGDGALLNNRGEAYAFEAIERYRQLPQLTGPERARQRMMQQYQVLSQMLRPQGFAIVRLELRERGSWFATLETKDGGQRIELLLGRDHVVEKVRRFLTIHDKTLRDRIANIARIDLRYANGLAVTWLAQTDAGARAATGGAVN